MVTEPNHAVKGLVSSIVGEEEWNGLTMVPTLKRNSKPELMNPKIHCKENSLLTS